MKEKEYIHFNMQRFLRIDSSQSLQDIAIPKKIRPSVSTVKKETSGKLYACFTALGLGLVGSYVVMNKAEDHSELNWHPARNIAAEDIDGTYMPVSMKFSIEQPLTRNPLLAEEKDEMRTLLVREKIDRFLENLTSSEVLSILSNEVEYIEREHPENYKHGVQLAHVWYRNPEIIKDGKPYLCKRIEECAKEEGTVAWCRAAVLLSLINDEELERKLGVLLDNERKKQFEERVPFPRAFENFVNPSGELALRPQLK